MGLLNNYFFSHDRTFPSENFLTMEPLRNRSLAQDGCNHSAPKSPFPFPLTLQNAKRYIIDLCNNVINNYYEG